MAESTQRGQQFNTRVNRGGRYNSTGEHDAHNGRRRQNFGSNNRMNRSGHGEYKVRLGQKFRFNNRSNRGGR